MSTQCYLENYMICPLPQFKKLHLITENNKEKCRASRETDFLLKLGENNFPIRAPAKET
jgi:hypothetical protein